MTVKCPTRLLLVAFFIWIKNSYSAVDEILNDYYFQNPAELSTVNQYQWILGNQYVSPKFQFEGVSSGQTGTATSHAQDFLPYMLAAYRFSDQFVMGINIVPSGYGHFEWPLNSIVANDSITTYLYYYKAIIQSSYQISNDLALGVGLNIEDNHRLELDFLVPSQGKQTNWISGMNVLN